VAADFGGGSGNTFFGAAGAWGMGSGRLQVSAAAGAQRVRNATRGSYGARATAGIWTSAGGGLAAAAFAGFGGAPRTRLSGVVTNPAVTNIPAGVSVALRHALGSTREVSAYATPFYRWTRTDSGTVTSTGTMRVSLGLDFAFSQSFGATIGAELGGKNGSSNTTSFGAALSFVPGRR